MDNPLIHCDALTKRFGQTEALRAVNLDLGRGRIVGLLGPNGNPTTNN